jgi:hypothetical protein
MVRPQRGTVMDAQDAALAIRLLPSTESISGMRSRGRTVGLAATGLRSVSGKA